MAAAASKAAPAAGGVELVAEAAPCIEKYRWADTPVAAPIAGTAKNVAAASAAAPATASGTLPLGAPAAAVAAAVVVAAVAVKGSMVPGFNCC